MSQDEQIDVDIQPRLRRAYVYGLDTPYSPDPHADIAAEAERVAQQAREDRLLEIQRGCANRHEAVLSIYDRDMKKRKWERKINKAVFKTALKLWHEQGLPPYVTLMGFSRLADQSAFFMMDMLDVENEARAKMEPESEPESE